MHQEHDPATVEAAPHHIPCAIVKNTHSRTVRKAILIYNPSSGQKRARRAEAIARAAGILSAAGVEAAIRATTGAGSAICQARDAVTDGFDTIIACGGDGTVNEVLNGVMLAGPDANVAIGVIPLGSGNILATDLRLPRNPEAAARALLAYEPRELHPGVISYESKAGPQKRWLIVVAGVGADAELMERTPVTFKERYGIYAYFLGMARMTLRRYFPMFQVEWLAADGSRCSAEVALVLAIRASRFPGLLRRVRLDADLGRNDYRLLLFQTGKVRHFISCFFSLASGYNWRTPQVEFTFSTWFRCTPLTDHVATPCEADGELLGTLPVEVGLETRTFKLLMGKRSH
jgi:diacylglycerol kinase family enzyme